MQIRPDSVLLGEGIRLFYSNGTNRIELGRTRLKESSGMTRIGFRVAK